MSGRPSRKSAEIGLFRPFSAFFALFQRVRRAPGKSRKRRKKAFLLRYPRISLNPHLLNPHLRHSKYSEFYNVSELRRACLRQEGVAQAVLPPGALFHVGAFALPPVPPNPTCLKWPSLQSLAVKKNFFFCKFWAVKNF